MLRSVEDRVQFLVTFLLALLLPASLSANPLAEPITPVPHPVFSDLEIEKIALGKQLFHDRRLSKDNSISCASCHNIDKAGIDGNSISTGINGAMGTVNAPTVFNSRFNVAQFWNGRADTLEEQASGPVHNPIEMGSTWNEVLIKLRDDAAYASKFNQIYSDFITSDNIVDAIATYERSLVTVDAPFDRYLRGEESAIPKRALEGYRLFKSYGCIACHQGVNVGGNMYSRMGAMDLYFTKVEDESDLGRFSVTGNEADRHAFKVPSLRLAVKSAPYFHDGSIATLEEAVSTMARYQLGREISDQDTALIIDFLHSLVGKPYEVPEQ